jgi:hypothetical protein
LNKPFILRFFQENSLFRRKTAVTLNTIRIRSGGQTGVDRAALDFALAKGIEYSGWCPNGGWAEDMQDPLGVLGRYPLLTETPSSRPEQRTAWNVRDSYGTLILAFGDSLERFPGTAFTRLCCELIFLKAWLCVDLARQPDASATAGWLRGVAEGLELFDLNVAGPRQSEAPGIYEASLRFLNAMWR